MEEAGLCLLPIIPAMKYGKVGTWSQSRSLPQFLRLLISDSVTPPEALPICTTTLAVLPIRNEQVTRLRIGGELQLARLNLCNVHDSSLRVESIMISRTPIL